MKNAPEHCWHLISEEATVPGDNSLFPCNTQIPHLVSSALCSSAQMVPVTWTESLVVSCTGVTYPASSEALDVTKLN